MEKQGLMERLGYFVIGIIEKIKAFIHRYTPSQWKRFGIITALVIAACVGIGMFINRDNAKLKAESAFISELNIILRERETHYDIPETMEEVLDIIEAKGYTAEQLQRTGPYTLLWSQTDNCFVLAEKDGDIVAPTARPKDFTGRSLDDGTVYIAPVDDIGDFKWKQEKVYYALTASVTGDVVFSTALQLDLNGHSVDGNILVQHDRAQDTLLENGVVTGMVVIDTPNGLFNNTASLQDVAVLQSGNYTENGSVYGTATVYSGVLTLGANARTLQSVGVADEVKVTDGAIWASAVTFSPESNKDPADAMRARMLAGHTADKVRELLQSAKLSDKNLETLATEYFGCYTMNINDYSATYETDGSVTTITVDGPKPAVFTVEYLEAHQKDVSAITVSVRREENGSFVFLTDGICSSGNGETADAIALTGADGVTTLLSLGETGIETTTGVVKSVVIDNVLFAVGAMQAPAVTLTFEDGTTVESYPGLVWNSSDPAVATVLGGAISAVSLGTAEITVRAGLVSTTAQAEVKPTQASIGTDQYVSLAAALEAAQPGDTITLSADNTETVTVSKPVTIAAAGFEPGEIICANNMVMNEMMDTYHYNGRVTAHVYGAIGDPDTVVDDTVTGTLSQVIATMTNLEYKYNTLHFELYLDGDYALEENVMLPVRVASATSFVITGDTTFDLNGHIISQELTGSAGGARPVFRVESGTLSITDHRQLGRIEACQTVAEVQAGAALDLTNVALTHQIDAAVTLIHNAGDITMDGCIVTSTADKVHVVRGTIGSTLDMTGNTLLSHNGSSYISGDMELTVHSGSFTAAEIDIDNGDILVEHATTNAGVFTENGSLYVKYLASSAKVRSENSQVVIEDGNFSGPVYAGDGLTIYTGRFTNLVYGYGDSVIHSGTYTSPVYLRGKTDIMNGTFNSSVFFYEDSTVYDGRYRSIVYMYEKEKTLLVYGGTFTDHLDAFYGTVCIQGGEFTHLTDQEGYYDIQGGEFRTEEVLQYLKPGAKYTETTRDGKTVYIVHAE